MLDSKIRLKFNQVFFRVDPIGYNNSINNYNFNYCYNTYVANTALANDMNVFICPGFTYASGIGQGFNGENINYVILQPTFANFLGGNNWEPHRLLVHEINHCLGLHHTFNPDRNSQTFLVDYKCDNCTNAYGSNGNNHNMMYGGASVWLSRLQMGHLRRNLSITWRKKLLVNQNLTNGDHIIEQNYLIPPNKLVVLTDHLIVKTGYTLTVEGMIRMGPGKRIIIQRGAKMIVNNGGKISSCNGNWESIYVEGSTNGQNTHTSSLVANKSGVLQLNSGSIIENSQNAVAMSAFHIPWPNNDYYGGYVYANGANFNNCGRAFEFMRYARNGAQDQSKVMNCSISNCTNGITVWEDDGIIIENNTFTNISQNAIYSVTAKITATNNVFL